jgi:thiol-disulfide isomerase/thioredoxin
MLSWSLAAVLAAAVSVASANVPKEIGPQGFLLWEGSRPVPALEFKDGEGRPLTLEDFHGKVVLLNIWATWCGPCREEMPTLDALQAELGGPEFEVLALSIDQAGVGAVEDFFKEIDLQDLRIYIDKTAMAAPKLGVVGIPTTLLLDRQGRELGRLVGAAEWDSPEMVKFFRDAIEKTRESSQ